VASYACASRAQKGNVSMPSKTTLAASRVPLRPALLIAAAVLLVSCSQDPAPPAGEAADPVAAPAQSAEPAQAVSDTVAALSPEQLREAAATAYRESRL